MANVSAEDVIMKLKDDGDFDRLRLKILRLLKQNEDLRNNIIAVVKQSAALNRPGAENMKPRQLCDAIHDEIRDKVMNQISDGLWEIIRSGDDMKSEIKETVQSVYDKLLHPQQKAEGGEANCFLEQAPLGGRTMVDGHHMVSGEHHGTIPNGEHNNASNNHASKFETQQPVSGNRGLAEQERAPHRGNNSSLWPKDKDHSPPTRLISSGKRRRASDDAKDEDPDVPPGFG